jgi:hypothetical protein
LGQEIGFGELSKNEKNSTLTLPTHQSKISESFDDLRIVSLFK